MVWFWKSWLMGKHFSLMVFLWAGPSPTLCSWYHTIKKTLQMLILKPNSNTHKLRQRKHKSPFELLLGNTYLLLLLLSGNTYHLLLSGNPYLSSHIMGYFGLLNLIWTGETVRNIYVNSLSFKFRCHCYS